MSLFDDASLVYIPTGYKPTKNYSGKPSTGGADMTFSRASGATRVNSRGLIEKVRTNLLLQSNSFDTTWFNTNSTETGGQAGYDGTTNAWLLDKNATQGRVTQSISQSGIQTLSVYAKKGTSEFLRMFVNGPNSSIYFNLNDGSVQSSASIVSGKSTDVGGGWYRCEVAFDGTTTAVNIYPAESGSTAGTSGNVYIQNAQLETGDIATNYIETTSAAVSVGPVNDEPRLTYNPVNPTAPSLLMEPQRTNLALYSEQFDNAAWSQTRGTITANAIASPDGYTNADLWAQNTGETTAAALLQNISVTSGTAYSLSVFAKKQNKNFLGIRANSVSSIPSYFDLENGTLGDINPLHTAKIEDYGNGWYRCSISYTTNSTIAGHIFYPTDGSSLTVTDSGGIYLFGAMHEAGSYGTSYIPTNGTSVTRVADASLKTGIGSLLSASEYTLYWEGTHIPTGQYNSFMTIYKASDLNSSARFYRNNTNNEIRAAIFDSVSGLSLDLGSGVTTQTAKCALRVKAGDYALYVNGNLVNSNTNALAPSSNLDAVNLQYFDSSQSFDQKTGQVLFFKTALSNATLATLTSL
jgi:hypothetical protein